MVREYKDKEKYIFSDEEIKRYSENDLKIIQIHLNEYFKIQEIEEKESFIEVN